MTYVRVIFDASWDTEYTGVNAIVDLPAGVDPADRPAVGAWLAANPDRWGDDIAQAQAQSDIVVGVESVWVIGPVLPREAKPLQAALHAWFQAAEGDSADAEHDAGVELAREVERLLARPDQEGDST